MFESAEIGHKVDKEQYKSQVPALRAALLQAQYDPQMSKKIPVVVLHQRPRRRGQGRDHQRAVRMDGPTFHHHAGICPAQRRRARAPADVALLALPPTQGAHRHFAGSWYSTRSASASRMPFPWKELDAPADQINRFEAMLVNEGALVLKFWFHLTKEGQVQRLKALERSRTAWRVTNGTGIGSRPTTSCGTWPGTCCMTNTLGLPGWWWKAQTTVTAASP